MATKPEQKQDQSEEVDRGVVGVGCDHELAHVVDEAQDHGKERSLDRLFPVALRRCIRYFVSEAAPVRLNEADIVLDNAQGGDHEEHQVAEGVRRIISCAYVLEKEKCRQVGVGEPAHGTGFVDRVHDGSWERLCVAVKRTLEGIVHDALSNS